MRKTISRLPTHELRIAKLNQDRQQLEQAARREYSKSLTKGDTKPVKLERKLSRTLEKIERRYKADLLALQALYENDSQKSTDKSRTNYIGNKTKVKKGVLHQKKTEKTNVRQETFDEAKRVKQKKIVLEAEVKGKKICVTCSGVYNIQGGHMIKAERRPTALLDINIHPQCADCNMYKDGEQKKMKEWFVEHHGQEKLDELILLSKTGNPPTIERMREEIKKDKARIKLLKAILKLGTQ